MADEHGIANIETTLGFFCGIGIDVEAALSDGKFTLTDMPRFLDDAMKVPGLIRAIPEVDDEFLDLTEDEQVAIVEFVKAKLNLPQADVTDVVAAGIDVMLSTSTTINKVKILVAAIKALKHPEL